MPVRAWQKIAQAFMPGPLRFEEIKSRRGRKSILSSLRDLVPWMDANPALKRWAIFFRGQSPLWGFRFRNQYAPQCGSASPRRRGKAEGNAGPSSPINLGRAYCCSGRYPRRQRLARSPQSMRPGAAITPLSLRRFPVAEVP
jgi:hypothetical protein